MTAATLRLARPVSAGDRARFLLIALSAASAGALLLAAVHTLRLPTGECRSIGPRLASYVTESGLRPGVVLAMFLLVVPVLALTVQALRVGSVARDRQMAALRLGGATPARSAQSPLPSRQPPRPRAP